MKGQATVRNTTGAPPDANRGRIRKLVRGHPRVSLGVVVSAIALAVFGFLWFRPDKLFVNSRVNDALPSAQATPTAGRGGPGAAQIRSTGSFRSLEHGTTGVAKLISLADGRMFVRLESFRTSNGPDVIVILSDAPATASAGAFERGSFQTLGVLKANIGNQNYQVPAGVDVAKFRSVVIWCRRFHVAFGAAPVTVGN
jgi:hypothetical protein